MNILMTIYILLGPYTSFSLSINLFFFFFSPLESGGENDKYVIVVKLMVSFGKIRSCKRIQ